MKKTEWEIRDYQSRSQGTADAEKASIYDAIREEDFPHLLNEVSSGVKPFKPIEFQPVRSPGIYEGEFAVKEGDLLFHFWPPGYHAAEDAGRPTPRFPKDFGETLKKVMEEVFRPGRVFLSDDRDVGAWAVKATDYGVNPFHRDLAIQACEKLHHALGGGE